MPISRVSLAVAMFVLLSSTLGFGQSAERYIVLDGSAAQAHVFNVSDNTKVADIRTGVTPNSAVIARGGRLVFAGNLNSQYVSVLDLTIQAEIARIPGVRAQLMAATADGSKIVATSPQQDLLTVIDVASLTVSSNISLNGLLGDDPANPNDLVFNNPVVVGNKVYLNTSFAIGVVDLTTSSVTTVATTASPRGFGSQNLAVTADGKYVLANRIGAFLLIDPTTDTVVQSLALGNVFCIGASNNAADPGKIYAYLLRQLPSGPVFSVLDLGAGSPTFGQVIADVPLPPGFPLNNNSRISANGDGTRAYVTAITRTSPNVLVLDTTNPAAAIINSFTVGVQARGATVGMTQTQITSSAPIVSGVAPALVKNDVANTIQISGSGFTADAHVRIGNLPFAPAQFISSTSLQVAIPAGAAAQGAPVVVSNENAAASLDSQWQGGILRGALVIASPPTFQPVHQVGATNFGESSFSTLNVSTDATLTPTIPTSAGPIGFAIAPDGSKAYIANFTPPAGIDVYNFATETMERHITLNGDPTSTVGQNAGVALVPDATSGHLFAYVVSSTQTGGVNQQQLYVIDTVTYAISSIPTNAGTPSPASGGLAITPDGKYAYINEFDVNDVTANFIIVDLTARTAVNSIQNSDPSLGISFFQPNLEISPDGKYILLGFDDGSFGVFDIGTDPAHPGKIATFRGTAPAGFSPLSFSAVRISGSHMIALDGLQNVVDIFNFNPPSDFAELATAVIPGTGTEFAIVPDVTPDGKLFYVPERDQDSVAVVDVDKVLLRDPTAFLTNISTGIAPVMVRVRPGTPTPLGTNVSVQPMKEVGLTFNTVTTAGATTVSTSNTNPVPVPAGFSIGTPPIFYEISSTASFTGTVQVCISYDPAQFSPPENSIRMLHDDAGTWTDVTTTQDTVSHVVCGNVTHFSAFTLGTASASFLFDSLIQEVSSQIKDAGLSHDLLEDLKKAFEAFNGGDNAKALQRVRQFQKKVQEAGSKLSQAEATKLLNTASLLRGLL